MKTHREVCSGCGFEGVDVHVCPGATRVHAGVGRQLAMLRAQLKRTREELAQTRAERDALRVQRNAHLSREGQS